MSWKDVVAAAIAAHKKGKPLTSSGAEIPDPVSMDPPLGYRPQPSMFEVIRKMIHDEKVRVALLEEGLETPEEADDFDIEDDPLESSPYEENFDPPAMPSDVAALERMRDEIDVRIRDLRGPAAPAPVSSGDSEAGPASTPLSREPAKVTPTG